MLIYGGRNDHYYNRQPTQMKKSLKPQMALDDIMLFDIENTTWIAVCQMGYRPEGRWSAAVSYEESTQQLFIFGGCGQTGTVQGTVYYCELNQKEVDRVKSKYRQTVDDVIKVTMKQQNH
jgi:hypothetical protein